MDTERQPDTAQGAPREHGNVVSAKVAFSREAQEIYSRLNGEANRSKVSRSILRAINAKIGLIKGNFRYGQPIAKALIPTEYRLKYGVTNLYHVKLPMFWRMLYSVVPGDGGVEIIAFVLDVIDHPTYDKKFGCKRQ
ncbi:MAG: hypothetical protein WCX64_06905 [Candidatus Micrarchaeia archaeon]